MSGYPQAKRDPPDLRMSPRSLTDVRAELCDASGAVLVKCVIRDQSAGGARLVFRGVAVLPEEFDVAEAGGRRIRRARLVWRDQKQAGVTWLPLAEPKP